MTCVSDKDGSGADRNFQSGRKITGFERNAPEMLDKALKAF